MTTDGMNLQQLQDALALAKAEDRFDDATAIKLAIDKLTTAGETDERLLPPEALTVEASDGTEGWNPPNVLPYTSVKLVKQISKKKRGSNKEDFRLELRYTESIVLKMFLSTLKRLWMDAGQNVETLLVKKGNAFDLNDKLQIMWEKSEDGNVRFPFKAKARHS